ncbi:hypothetical protein [Phaeodactylibacter luteus]|uniref:Porin family protein n=1 Tax=Phaeodactylibacter luteus TaxID=1564516 RepID=A0A5C6S769_9BACT|nr:hypothetical protein [Phaeodactylibacter luteus]TXB70265.1 hypothetical protein FRY97_00755 [Phaeodactylibacter luteus]
MYTDRINIRRALSLTLLAVWFAPLWAGAQAVADVTEISYLDGVGGFYQEAAVGFAAGSFAGTPSVGVELAYAAGYQWKTAFGGGLSAGVAAYRHQPGYTYYPVMAEARGYIWDNSSAPYYKLGIGYGFSFQESHEEVVAAKGGLCNQLALGLRFISDRRIHAFVEAGYRQQRGETVIRGFDGWWGNESEEKQRFTLNRLMLRTGILF